MKTVFFKYLLISMSLLAFVSGCGGDNKTSSNAISDPGSTGVKYNPITGTQNVSDFATFKTKVQNGNFKKKDSATTEIICKMVESDMGIPTGNWFHREENTSTVNHPNGKYDSTVQTTHLAIVTKLHDILNNVTTSDRYERVGDAAFWVKDKRNDNMYLIDLNTLLICNPIEFDNKSYQGYFLQNIYEN